MISENVSPTAFATRAIMSLSQPNAEKNPTFLLKIFYSFIYAVLCML